MRIWPVLAGLAAAALLGPAATPAFACSKDDTAYFDSFLDTACLQTLSGTELDAFGGIRLTTNGTPTAHTWDTHTQFDDGISYQSKTYGPVGVSTLERTGTGTVAVLGLPTIGLPLRRDAGNPVIEPAGSATPDNDNIDDPAIVKDGSTYVIYYSATAEDGSGPVIMRATSSDGKAWSNRSTVIQPTPGTFDERGVFAPDVVFDAGATPKYRMWYSGRGDTFGGIGYATSDDGIAWTEYDDGDADTDPDAVLTHGKAGSADSFSAQDPSVLLDGTTWKMWYTGDDSNRKRIAFATSPDGIVWSKGGKVIAPEDSVPANLAEGAFAPTVWKDNTGFRMVFSGRKFVSGTTYQTKLINATSSDGIAWTTGSIALNPQSGTFAASNLNAPDVLEDSGVPNAERFKLYYSGNSIDARGNFHTRIGLATSSNGNSWSRFAGAGLGQSVLDLTAFGIDFDAREASGPSVVAPPVAPSNFYGFYWGNRGSDFLPRLGEATSADGSAWTKVAGAQEGGSLLALGTTGQFDAGGQRDPAALYELNMAGDDYHLYFTALSGADPAAMSIGHSSSANVDDTTTQVPSVWSDPSAALTIGADTTGFDATGASHPSVVKEGATYFMYYTGWNGSTPSIGCATSTAPDFATVTKDVCTTLAPTPGSFDANGVRDPVVWEAGTNDYRMTYTGIEVRNDPGGDPQTIERIGYATSTDGTSWTKVGVVLGPSPDPFGFDERGVEPAGAVLDGATLHYFYDGVDRGGRRRGGHATVDTGAGADELETGRATYQVGDPSTTVRDWQQIRRTSSGDVTLWVSFLQPYSAAGKEFWSDYFPVTVSSTTEALNFLLTVRGVRWQVRERTSGTAAALDKVQIDSAPVQFTSSGTALTKDIGAPSGDQVLAWRSLTATSTTYAPNGGTGAGTVDVLDSAGTTTLASQALNTSGDTTIDISGISASDHPTLKVRFTLTGGQASPLVQSLKALYYTNASPPPTVTLSASPTTVDAGGAVTLSGNVSISGAPVSGQTVSLLQRAPGASAFTSAGSAGTDGSGNFQSTVTPTATTEYAARYADVTSALVTVTVNPPPPPPPAITIAATPAEIVYGEQVVLGGNLSQAGAPLGSQVVQLLEQPAGAAAFTPFATATSDAAGNWAGPVTPQSNTAFQASFDGATPATAAVGVHQLVKLRGRRSGRRVVMRGTVAPAHPAAEVVIQRQKGTSFVTFAKVTTNSKSAFTLRKRLKPCGKFRFRATTAADADHLDGTSRIALVEKHRIALKVAVRGRRAVFTGKVSPRHRSGTVLIRRLKGKRARTIARARLNRRSAFRLVKKLTKGRYRLRAEMRSDRCHFGGRSRARRVRVR